LEVETIQQVISNVGFPIFVAVFMLWERHQLFRELKEELARIRQIMSEQKVLELPGEEEVS